MKGMRYRQEKIPKHIHKWKKEFAEYLWHDAIFLKKKKETSTLHIVFKKSRKIHRILVTVFISKRRNEVENGDEEIFSLYL